MEEAKQVGYGKCVLIKSEGSAGAGTVMEIEPGKQTDMQFHRVEGKVVYVMMGKIKVTVIKDGKISSIDVGAGNSFFVKAGLVHQLTAIDSVAIVIEFGTAAMHEDLHCVFKGSQIDRPLEVKKEETKEQDAVLPEEAPKTVKKPTIKKRQQKRKK